MIHGMKYNKLWIVSIFFVCTKLFSQNFYDSGIKEYFMGHDSLALKYFNIAIEKEQNLANAYMMRSSTYNMLGNYVKAFSDIRISIQLDSNNAKAYFYYGRIYFAQKFYSNAIKYYTISISKNPKDPDVYDDRAMCYLLNDDYLSAINDETMAIKLNPNNGVYYNQRGYIKIKQKNYDEAIKDLDMSLKINPTANAYANKGLVFYELKEFEKAIPLFSNSLAINGRDKEVLYYRGISYLRINRESLACMDLRKSASYGFVYAEKLIRESCDKR